MAVHHKHMQKSAIKTNVKQSKHPVYTNEVVKMAMLKLKPNKNGWIQLNSKNSNFRTKWKSISLENALLYFRFVVDSRDDVLTLSL